MTAEKALQEAQFISLLEHFFKNKSLDKINLLLQHLSPEAFFQVIFQYVTVYKKDDSDNKFFNSFVEQLKKRLATRTTAAVTTGKNAGETSTAASAVAKGSEALSDEQKLTVMLLQIGDEVAVQQFFLLLETVAAEQDIQDMFPKNYSKALYNKALAIAVKLSCARVTQALVTAGIDEAEIVQHAPLAIVTSLVAKGLTAAEAVLAIGGAAGIQQLVGILQQKNIDLDGVFLIALQHTNAHLVRALVSKGFSLDTFFLNPYQLINKETMVRKLKIKSKSCCKYSFSNFHYFI